jgi:predicted DNA-binding protein
MTLTLHLPPELEQRLIQEAKRQGLPPATYTLQLLGTHLPPNEQCLELVTLLDAWIAEGDSEEHQETGEYLVRVLDEDRLADRELFPPELKGVTW